ncbi:MAG: PKD domain-containing protein [Bacteroidota bacterium]
MKTNKWILTGLCLGCFSISVQLKAQLTATITDSANVSCNGGCNGDATVSVSGGTGPFGYMWNDPMIQTNTTATGLCAGTYIVTVTDSSDTSTATDNITITEPPALVTLIIPTDVSCNGNCDGAATVTVSGGVPPYAYLWNTGQMIQVIMGLCPGIYSITITDANGCTVTDSTVISEPPPLVTVIDSIIDATCGMCDGSIFVSGTGGTAPYTYLWDDPAMQTTTTPTNLCAGTYTVTVTDNNGCVNTASATVNDIAAFSVTITSTDVSCIGDCDGTATATPTGGSPPFTYLWNTSPVTTTQTITGMCQGTYTVWVTDNSGCSSNQSVTINQPQPISSNITTTDATCSLCDGSATANPTGGTPPYSYLWTGGDTTQTDTGLCQGSYNLQITDSNGCAYDTTFIIYNASGFTASISSVTNASCNGVCDGSATLTASGGTAPYTYLWDDPSSQITATATGLCAGIYSVTVTDSAGCFYSDSTPISEPAMLTIVISSVSDVSCNGGSNGQACLTVSGGTVPYTYTWDPPVFTSDPCALSLTAGTYLATVEDANGCSDSVNVTINEPTPLIASIASQTDATCGSCNGNASVSASGGTFPYAYSWNTGDSSNTVIGLCGGIYSVVIYDANGCDTMTSVIINDIPPFTFNLSIIDATCGNCDGNATSNPAGGSQPYTYSWTNGDTTQTADSLCSGSLTLQITDSAGCILDTTFTINNTAGLTASITSVTDVSCNGDSNGTGIVTPNGGTPPYTYLWDDTQAQTDSMAINLAPGTYNVTVTDSAGCNFTLTTSIPEPPPLTLSLFPTDVSCNQTNDGYIYINASGGVENYQFSIDSGSTWTYDSSFFNLFPGTYEVIVQDSNGCQASDTTTIDTSTSLNISATVTNAGCGWNNGSIMLSISGGIAPYTYQWSPGSWWWGSYKNYLPAGFYNVTVTDAGNCSNTASIFVGDGCAPNLIKGKVFDDMNDNCLMDSADFGLSGWLVKADPGQVYAYSDNSGNYHMYLDSGNYTISLIDNDVLRTQVCPSSPPTYGLSLGTSPDTVNNIDFSVQSASYCPALSVNFYHIGFRPCISSWYKINYTNNGTGTAYNAYIELELPPEVTATLVSGNIYFNKPPYNSTPWDSQSGNIYTYNLGDVAPQQSGSFYVLIEVSCNAVMNSTLCVTAHIYPDSSCFPPDPAWDHSSVAVVGKCVGDSLACFTIYNTGDPGTGDMQGAAEYRIYENNIQVSVGTFQIAGADSTVICWTANSNTIRLEADQRPGHPGNSHPQDNVELCGVPTFVTGQITQVPEDDIDDFIEIFCDFVKSSWDPNDKNVLPEGLTETYHYIDSTDILEYLIRFQNTGNDTAFKVVIRDTLSTYLDISTIEPGASSHPFTFDIYESDIIQFTFDSIMLPDSIVNEPESHGFVKFEINQQPGNTKGTVIENEAGIVFDYNEPVNTNTIFNTIGNIDSITCFINAGFTFQGADQTVTFTSASSNADSYYWDLGDGNTSTQQNYSHIYSDTGTYIVTLIVNNDCGIDTISKEVTIQSTGIYQTGYDGYQITVYPNPFNSTTTFEVLGTGKPGPLTFELHNILGERVNVMKGISGNKFVVSREGLTDGIYFYKISSVDGLITAGKLVIN